MTDQYLFQGVVLPERAQISIDFALNFSHLASEADGTAHISIILNQVAVTVESSHEWDIFDLRNVVASMVRGQLDAVGYLMGYAYELEISRVINRGRSIDYVFGIDVPCISARAKPADLATSLSDLRGKLQGRNGIYVSRCLTDLISAMKNADDTGFYCYRALESLRHHCAAVYGLSGKSKANQWAKFREVASAERSAIDRIKAAADPLRHGDVASMSSQSRGELLTTTWDVVDCYLGGVQM
ncbi:hypothetical protein [Aerolutibacter ruishenii]|uniref:Uncharacterized protein n=1 Tax=Aerolutibacter ruishenii TaxID=686800 RepID=A0A562M3D5_9GAMM|nr:hypothetical protein [Lysobacter ruishenii]TWI14457.1 hypothetical protein IP93_00455 [Lysobacter ruishenii]